MKKTLTFLLFAVLIMVLFPVAVLADGYDGSGGVIIDTAPATDLQTSVEALTASANVTNLTITIPSAANYALSYADQNYMSSSLTNLQTLDIADTVFFDADGNGTLGDVMDAFFGGHNNLQSVSLPSAVAFGEAAFDSCTSLASVSIPSATTFAGSAFASCYSLASINLPSAATFGDGAFLECTSLTSVTLPSVTTFGFDAFSMCTSLESISLPSATTFADGAFGDCTLLASVTLPSATTFGDDIFMSCPLAIELTLGSTVPTVGSFNYGFPTGATVRVPDTAYTAYDNDPLDTAGAAGDDMWLDWPMEIYVIPVVTPEPAVNPQTGDSQSAYLWLLLLVAVGFVSALFIRKRRLSH